MPIAPTNQSKNIVTPSNQGKYGNTQAIYGLGVYGLVVYGVGTPSGIPTNQSKSSQGSTSITSGMPMGLLLSLTYPSDIIIGSGVTNQSKN